MVVESKNIIHDQWLTGVIGRNVYRIIVNDDFIKSVGDKTYNEYKQLVELQSSPVFLFSKVSVLSLTQIKFLEKLYFNLIETNIVFSKPVSTNEKYIGKCELRFAISEDQEQVANIAMGNFIYSRFHMDKVIPLDVANKIKAEWVSNFFLGKRGDYMIVAMVDGVVAGFLQILCDNDNNLVIDLIAVDKQHRGKGVATDMITYAQTQLKQFNNISAGTQVANTPSMNLYEKIGFRISGAQYVFHYHNLLEK